PKRLDRKTIHFPSGVNVTFGSPVIVCSQVDKSFSIDSVAGPIYRPEEIDPLSVAGSGHALRSPAISGEKFSILGNVEMDGPLFARYFVADLFAGLDDEAGKPEFFSFGRLQVIPDGFAVA